MFLHEFPNCTTKPRGGTFLYYDWSSRYIYIYTQNLQSKELENFRAAIFPIHFPSLPRVADASDAREAVHPRAAGHPRHLLRARRVVQALEQALAAPHEEDGRLKRPGVEKSP